MVWPPLTPPPAIHMVKPHGLWSRPYFSGVCPAVTWAKGVRPNSPPQPTNVSFNMPRAFKSASKPVAGLLADLKARGMLKDTLVVWGGEFGRTPFAQVTAGQTPEKYGRDHNPWGFTMWMAGGGVKGGQTIGTPDETGLRAVDEPHHVWDIHASILNLLGLDHLRTTYAHNGRQERPTVTGGHLIKKLWA